MARIAILLIMQIWFLLPAAAQTDDELKAVAKITIVNTATGATRLFGSGIALGKEGFILTARHVVSTLDKSSEILYVEFGSSGAVRYRGEVSSCHTSADACLVQISGAALLSANIAHFPRLGCRTVAVFEEVRAAGFPGDTISDMDQVKGDVTANLNAQSLYPTTASALPGMSGGPVFDRSGRVIGLVKGALETSAGLPVRVFFTPLFRVQTLIRDTPYSCDTEYDPDTPPTTPIAPISQLKSYTVCEGEHEQRCRPYDYDIFVGCYQVDRKVLELCGDKPSERISLRPSEGGNRCGYSWYKITC